MSSVTAWPFLLANRPGTGYGDVIMPGELLARHNIAQIIWPFIEGVNAPTAPHTVHVRHAQTPVGNLFIAFRARHLPAPGTATSYLTDEYGRPLMVIEGALLETEQPSPHEVTWALQAAIEAVTDALDPFLLGEGAWPRQSQPLTVQGREANGLPFENLEQLNDVHIPKASLPSRPTVPHELPSPPPTVLIPPSHTSRPIPKPARHRLFLALALLGVVVIAFAIVLSTL